MRETDGKGRNSRSNCRVGPLIAAASFCAALHKLTNEMHARGFRSFNGGSILLFITRELPRALDPARTVRLAADYLKVMEVEFKLRNPELKK